VEVQENNSYKAMENKKRSAILQGTLFISLLILLNIYL
jgi:hypothetical protein